VLRKFGFNLCCGDRQIAQSADRIVRAIRVKSVRKVWLVLMDHDASLPELNIDVIKRSNIRAVRPFNFAHISTLV
jgi:hypothetical protein